MDQATKTQIILAAINATGGQSSFPDASSWRGEVAANVTSIAAMIADRSDISHLLDAMEDAKVFIATIDRLQVEESSNRVLVTLKSTPSDKNPEGVEYARTERLDTPVGKISANRLKALKGHRALVWIELQQMSGKDRKVRILLHAEDLGAVKDG